MSLDQNLEKNLIIQKSKWSLEDDEYVRRLWNNPLITNERLKERIVKRTSKNINVVYHRFSVLGLKLRERKKLYKKPLGNKWWNENGEPINR